MKTHFGAVLSNSIASALVIFVTWGHCTKRGFVYISLYSELYLHVVPQVLPCISYIQWLTVWNICLRVQNHRRNDIVAWGQFLTNHGDTVTNHLIIIAVVPNFDFKTLSYSEKYIQAEYKDVPLPLKVQLCAFCRVGTSWSTEQFS